MLYMLYGSHSDPKRLDRIVRHELAELIQIKGASPEVVDKYLAEVFDSAMTVDMWIECCKENASVVMHDPETRKRSGFAYKEDPTMMQDMGAFRNLDTWTSADGRPVEFIARPALQIWGDSVQSVYEMNARGQDGALRRYEHSTSPEEIFVQDYQVLHYVRPMLLSVDQFPDQDKEEAEDEVKKDEQSTE